MARKRTLRLQVERRKSLITPKQRERERARVFRPLAIEIGWLVYEWNRMQAALGELFADVLSKDSIKVPLAVWHSVTQERTQREMLRAAVAAANQLGSLKPRACEDIIWILKELNALAGRRNDAIHAPLVFINEVGETGVDSIQILPMYFFGNPRAAQLRDKHLLKEFQWYRDHLSKFADFAGILHYAIIFPEHAWPDRPQLLPRDQFRSPRAKHRKIKSK